MKSIFKNTVSIIFALGSIVMALKGIPYYGWVIFAAIACQIDLSSNNEEE